MTNETNIAVLTETNAYGTLVQDMDAGVKKLLARLEQIEREESKLRQERNGIRVALSVIGVTPPKDLNNTIPTVKETQYSLKRPFEKALLTDACLMVLRDHANDWLDKNQIEYLVARGGYQFNTSDAKNSVHVTLRRLSDEGKIDAQRVRGSHGNRYKAIGETK